MSHREELCNRACRNACRVQSDKFLFPTPSINAAGLRSACTCVFHCVNFPKSDQSILRPIRAPLCPWRHSACPLRELTNSSPSLNLTNEFPSLISSETRARFWRNARISRLIEHERVNPPDGFRQFSVNDRSVYARLARIELAAWYLSTCVTPAGTGSNPRESLRIRGDSGGRGWEAVNRGNIVACRVPAALVNNRPRADALIRHATRVASRRG